LNWWKIYYYTKNYEKNDTIPNADQRPYWNQILKDKWSLSSELKELLDKIYIIVDYKLSQLKEKFLEVFIETKLKEKHIVS
jgi:predicted P-loop ATPase/GTPase